MLIYHSGPDHGQACNSSWLTFSEFSGIWSISAISVFYCSCFLNFLRRLTSADRVIPVWACSSSAFLGKRQARGIPTNGNALGPSSGSLQTWTRVQNLSSLRWALESHAPRHPVLPSALYFTTGTRSFLAFTGSLSHTACTKCRHGWGVHWCASREVWRRCGCLAGGLSCWRAWLPATAELQGPCPAACSPVPGPGV